MAAQPETQNRSKTALDLNNTSLIIIIIATMLITSLAQPAVLGKLPLQNLLLHHLHVSKTQMASFFFLIGLAWYFKPFAGIFTDAFPLFGTRRRHYLIISSALAALSWIGLGLVPRTYSALLWMSMIINAFLVIASTVSGAILVEAGQAMGSTGKLTTLRGIVMYGINIFVGPMAGFLATVSFAFVTGANGIIMFLLVPITFIFLIEQRRKSDRAEIFSNTEAQMKSIGKSGVMWAAVGFLFLYYFAPGFATPLYFRQNNVLHFSQQAIGNIGIFSGASTVLGAILYGYLIQRFPIRKIIIAGVLISSISTMAYLLYNPGGSAYVRAVIIDSQAGFFGGMVEMALMDLAARATPRGSEGLGYSLIMSSRNLALFGSDILGSRLADAGWHLPFVTGNLHETTFHSLVYLNAGTTLLVVFVAPFLPGAIMHSKDGTPINQEAMERDLAGEAPGLQSEVESSGL